MADISGHVHPWSENQLPSNNWFNAFLNHHPELSLRQTQPLNEARAQMLNPWSVEDMFKKLKDHIDTYSLIPDRIWNTDEKSFYLFS